MIGRLDKIQQYFNATALQEGIGTYALDLVLTVVLAYILGLVYTKFGKSISNRKSFSNNFVLLALTTMTIITVVKSSLALSLGLVGALSIVRFRAAIKDPEELTFLFAVISVGLGIGAGQRYIVLVSFLAFVCVVMIMNLIKKVPVQGNFFITLSFSDQNDVQVEKVLKILNQYASQVSFKRLEETVDGSNFVFNANITDAAKMDDAKSALKGEFKNLSISFLEDNGVFNM